MTSALHRLIPFATALTLVLAIDALAVASTAAAGVRAEAVISCASSYDARGDGISSVVVVADQGRTTALASQIRAAGGRVCDRFGRLLNARIPDEARSSLQRDAASIRPPSHPYALTLDEGVASTRADAWQARGLRGVGVAVAIIDLGFAGLAEAQAAGVVPSSAVKVDMCPLRGFLGNKHGTAVAEVVAAEAPAAPLYLICVDDIVELAQAEAFVASHGIPIVNHSVGWFNTGPGDGRGGPGTPDAIVAAAHKHGILWINAAGNEAQRHWRGRFTDANANGYLDFVPGDDVNLVSVPVGAEVCAFLRWAEWPNPTHDYVLELVDTSSGIMLPTYAHEGLPMRTSCWTNGKIWDQEATVAEIRVRAPNGAGTALLELFVEGAGELTHYVEAGSIADPAASANVLAVGAVCWQDGKLERFSSQGPTIDGRMKPELVAPDSVSSGTYGAFSRCGISGFAGTSAAAPHVAGAAALVKQRFPSYSAAKLEAYLIKHAGELGELGYDNLFGAGRLLMPTIGGPARPNVRALAARGSFGGLVRLTFEVDASPMEVRTSVEIFAGQRIVSSPAQAYRTVDGRIAVTETWRAPRTAARGATFRFCVKAEDAAGATSEPSCARIRLQRP